jgi:hypothetical protein
VQTGVASAWMKPCIHLDEALRPPGRSLVSMRTAGVHANKALRLCRWVASAQTGSIRADEAPHPCG